MTSPSQPVYVVLDANIIVASPLLSPGSVPGLKELLDRSSEWDIRFVVPQVAFEEAVKNVRAQRKKVIQDLRSIKVEFADTTGAKDRLIADVTARMTTYEDDLRARLNELDCQILPWPAVTTEELARKSLGRLAPFHREKDGLRDALIWATVKDLTQQERPARVIFVSENVNDFGGKAAGKELPDDAFPYPLHAHLLQELNDAGIDHSEVLYVRRFDRVEQGYAAFISPATDAERDEVLAEVAGAEITGQIVAALIGLVVDQPPSTLSQAGADYVISFATNEGELEILDLARRAHAGWTVDVSLEASATVVERVDGEHVNEYSRDLVASGRVTLDGAGSVQLELRGTKFVEVKGASLGAAAVFLEAYTRASPSSGFTALSDAARQSVLSAAGLGLSDAAHQSFLSATGPALSDAARQSVLSAAGLGLSDAARQSFLSAAGLGLGLGLSAASQSIASTAGLDAPETADDTSKAPAAEGDRNE